MSIIHSENIKPEIEALEIFPKEIWRIILFDVVNENNSTIFPIQIAMELRLTCKLFAGICPKFIQDINDRVKKFADANLNTFPTLFLGTNFFERTIQTVSPQTGWIAGFYLPIRQGKTATITYLALLYALIYSNKKVAIVTYSLRVMKIVFKCILDMTRNACIKVDETDFKHKLALPNRSTIEVLSDMTTSFFKQQIRDQLFEEQIQDIKDSLSTNLLLLDEPDLLDKRWRIPRETNSKTIVSFGSTLEDGVASHYHYPDLIETTKSPWPNDVWQTKQFPIYNSLCDVKSIPAAVALSVAVQNNGYAKFYVYKK